MNKFFTTIIQKRWVVAAIFTALALYGYYSWTNLAIDVYPDIADTSTIVVTEVPGLAAEEVEQLITIPLERALSTLPGMHVMRSMSTFGLSNIVIVFEDGVEDHWSRHRIQERLAEVELPFDAEPELEPLTSPVGEIYRYIVISDRHTLRELTDLQLWTIIPRLHQVPGVIDVANFGGITTQFNAEICPNLLMQFGLSLEDVVEAIEEGSAAAAGNIINIGDLMYVVRGMGLVRSLEDIGNIMVCNEGGVPVFVRDVARMHYGEVQRVGALSFTDRYRNLNETVGGIVCLLRHENPSRVLPGIHAAIYELNNGGLPEGVQILTYMDRTDLIDNTIRTVGRNISIGMLLVIFVLVVFLRSWRGALLVALTVPLSFLIAFILMNFFGVPANILSLGAVSFGIIVDGAIVMVETVMRKRERNPDKFFNPEVLGKRMASVGKPIFFATIIMIVTYLPLFAFTRVERALFTPLAFMESFALFGALLVALFFVSAMAYALYRKPSKVKKALWFERWTLTYANSISRVILKPKKIVIATAIIFVGAIGLSIGIGKDFMPKLDEGSIWVQAILPPGITLEKSQEIAAEIRATAMEFDEVSLIAIQAGRNDEGTDYFTPSFHEIYIGMRPYREWPRGRRQRHLVEDLDRAFSQIPGIISLNFTQPMIDGVREVAGGAHTELVIRVFGNDLTEGRIIAENIVGIVRGIRGAADVGITQTPPKPQMRIDIDRMAIARHDLTVEEVTDFINIGIGGAPVGEIFIEDRVYDITARIREDMRSTPDQIGNLRLMNEDGAQIPLAQLADISLTTGESVIAREMMRRMVTVQLNLRGRDMGSFVREAKAAIAANVEYDPRQFSIEWGGDFENKERAYAHLSLIIPMVLLLIFLLLYAAFGKARQAGLVMIIVPLAVFGGMAALMIRGMTFNVSSAVGFLGLFGIAITNGVLMISHINDLRKKRMGLKHAVRDGVRHRFRPIVMTSIVAMLGLLPATLATTVGSDFQRPLATVIVYGLLFSVLLTLYVLPTFYYIIEAWQVRKEREKSFELLREREMGELEE